MERMVRNKRILVRRTKRIWERQQESRNHLGMVRTRRRMKERHNWIQRRRMWENCNLIQRIRVSHNYRQLTLRRNL